MRSRAKTAVAAALLCLAVGVFAAGHGAGGADAPAGGPLCMVVMDPLAARLSCPCVQGYAQRDYAALAAHLREALNREVKLGFGESLRAGLENAGCARADLVIGKDSVVRADAATDAVTMEPVALLTDKRGSCTTRGLFVVPADDVVESLDELFDYTFFIGGAEHAEKHGMALLAMRGAGLPEPFDTRVVGSCSDAAAEMLELPQPAQAAAVISSYAEPLLEGCGAIPKGALRVVGETAPVPFITAFVRHDTDYTVRDALTRALLDVANDEELSGRLESARGFIRPTAHESAEWTGWRSRGRDGHAPGLPGRLPQSPRIVWSRLLSRSGLGGIAADGTHVVLGDRDDADCRDVFRCFDPETGQPLWELSYDAPGSLDYGTSPRATPLIDNGRVHLLGAMGDLHCVDLNTGAVIWRRHLVRDFGVPEKLFSAWGYCSSPLIADGRLIVNPGAPDASVVALDPATGREVWRSPGRPAGYGSFVAAYPGGRCQVIGFDESTLGGWDAATGHRLWTVAPRVGGGFNVPTPVVLDGDPIRIVVSTDTDGTRLYALGRDGTVGTDPTAVSEDLSAEMATPVAVGHRVFCVQERFFELDANDGLRTRFVGESRFLGTYAAVVSGATSVLAIGNNGRLLLYDISGGTCRLVSEANALPDEASDESLHPVYSHPAVVGTRLFLRGANELVCVELAADEEDDEGVATTPAE